MYKYIFEVNEDTKLGCQRPECDSYNFSKDPDYVCNYNIFKLHVINK